MTAARDIIGERSEAGGVLCRETDNTSERGRGRPQIHPNLPSNPLLCPLGITPMYSHSNNCHGFLSVIFQVFMATHKFHEGWIGRIQGLHL